MSDEYDDDGDTGGPTSHRYLYEMDRENLFALFVGAVASLRVDDDGAHCLSAEAQGISRMARAVQTRTDDGTRERRLRRLATVTRVLLSRTDSSDRGEEEPDYVMPLPDLVAHFLRLRTEVGDFIPAASPEAVPDDVAAMDEPEDEELPFDHPHVQAMIAANPDLEPLLREAYS